jgi:osomolarity two-component system, response regulator SKN7
MHNTNSLENIRVIVRTHNANIQRKAPAVRKSPQPVSESTQISDLQNQIESLTRYQDRLARHLQGLSHQYQTVVSKMLNFQRTLTTQDTVMQNIIQYMVNPETNPAALTGGPILLPEQAQKLIGSYDEAARASLDVMNDLSQLGASLSPTRILENVLMTPQVSTLRDTQYPPSRTITSPYSSNSELRGEHRTPSREGYTSVTTSPEPQGTLNVPTEHDLSDTTTFPGFGNSQFPPQDLPANGAGGLRVFTVGHFAPRDDDTSTPTSSLQQPAQPNMLVIKDTDERQPNALRVRRQTFVPGWAVPPKILLVDDDAVYRNMSSKFLQVFGCEADVAVDGMSALDKLNVGKYDLILMDVVMPNLDGITATNMIRQFDLATPIISMTSNIRSDDIIHYFESGT